MIVNILKLRYQSLYDYAERDIRQQLSDLLVGIQRALVALDEGYSLDEHLLTNAGQVTASIGRRNALLELKPMIEEGKEEEERSK